MGTGSTEARCIGTLDRTVLRPLCGLRNEPPPFQFWDEDTVNPDRALKTIEVFFYIRALQGSNFAFQQTVCSFNQIFNNRQFGVTIGGPFFNPPAIAVSFYPNTSTATQPTNVMIQLVGPSLAFDVWYHCVARRNAIIPGLFQFYLGRASKDINFNDVTPDDFPYGVGGNGGGTNIFDASNLFPSGFRDLVEGTTEWGGFGYSFNTFGQSEVANSAPFILTGGVAEFRAWRTSETDADLQLRRNQLIVPTAQQINDEELVHMLRLNEDAQSPGDFEDIGSHGAVMTDVLTNLTAPDDMGWYFPSYPFNTVTTVPLISNRVAPYQIQNTVSVTRTATYQVNHVVEATRTGVYQVRNAFAATRNGAYQVRNAFASTQTAAYQANPLSPLTATRTGTYQALDPLTVARPITYQVRDPNTFTRNAAYQQTDLQLVAFVRTATYQVRDPGAFTRTGTYQALELLSFTRTGVYQTFELLSFTRTATYQLITPFIALRRAVYQSFQALSFTRTGAYQVRNAFTATRTGAYQALDVVSVTRTAPYQVITQAQSFTRTATYQVIRSAANLQQIFDKLCDVDKTTKVILVNTLDLC